MSCKHEAEFRPLKQGGPGEGSTVADKKNVRGESSFRTFLKAEKEKTRGLDTAARIRYVLDYYWIPLLGLFCALFLVCYIGYRAFFVPKDYWFYGMFANTGADAGNGSQLWHDFKEYAGYDTKQKKLEFNASSWFDPSLPGGTNNSYYQAFVALAESGELDVVTLPEDALTALGSSGRLLDLTGEECGTIFRRYADRLVYCDPYDEEYSDEPVPVGIDLSDSLLVTEYGLYEESCVLGISAWSSRIEDVETFLEFVLPAADGKESEWED